MINTMFNVLRRQRGGIGFDFGDSRALEQGGDAVVSRQEHGTDTEASTCTLWSAISLGALVQGQPTAAVRLRWSVSEPGRYSSEGNVERGRS